MSQPASNGTTETTIPVGSSELLEALRRWRYFEKRHAAVVLGEIDIDAQQAKEVSDRALHQLRIVADRAITQASNDKLTDRPPRQ
jgi:hypothetical protein